MVDAVVTNKPWGGQNMFAPLRRVLVQGPLPPAADNLWQEYGYVRPIDYQQGLREHQAFCAMLAAAGAEVVHAGSTDQALQDAMFTYDPSYITDAGAVLCRMGKVLRRPEALLAGDAMARLGIPVIGAITEPGTLEGGDCLWLDERTLVVGRGYRTNGDGIRQLSALLAPHGVTVLAVDLPHWQGPAECLHLLSFISIVNTGLAVVYLPLMAVALVDLLRERGFTLIEIPEEEFATQGTNVLATGPGRCILLRENVGTAHRLRTAGCEVRFYAGDELSHNRAGGPTCLTRPLLRG